MTFAGINYFAVLIAAEAGRYWPSRAEPGDAL